MSSHPDADAFLRAILHDLADATPRLVFADWLEETGDPGNIAWARYIRVQAELAAQPAIGGRWGELEAQAADEAPRIHATLQIPARLFVEQARAVLRLLPIEQLTVNLDGFVVPRPIAEYVPASIAHEHRVLPLAVSKRDVHLAMADRHNGDTLQILQFILNRRVVPIATDPESIPAAVERTYGPVHAEFHDQFIEFTDPPPPIDPSDPNDDQGEPLRRLANLILREAHSLGANRVLISPIGGPRLRYRLGESWSDGEALPARLLTPLARVFAQAAGTLGEFERKGGGNGAFNWSIPGSPLHIRVTLETLEEGPVIQLDLAGPAGPEL